MASGTHEVKYVAADGTLSDDKFFTGNSAISFADLRKNFSSGSGNPSNVRLGDYLRDTDATQANPVVPNSPSNQNVKTSQSNMGLSDYRNTLKKIRVTLEGTSIKNYNADHVWTSETASQLNENTVLSGDLITNTPKEHLITSQQTVVSATQSEAAMVFNPSEVVHNLELKIQGEVHGFSGVGGQHNASWDEGKTGGDGGAALEINPGSGSGKILVNVEGGGGAVWGGGGGGAGGYSGEDGQNGVQGSPGQAGESKSTECTLGETVTKNWEWSRKNYVRYWWRERCKRRRGWSWRRRHRKKRSRCEKSEWTRTRCTGYYSGAGQSKSGTSGRKGYCMESCESKLGSGELATELVSQECSGANRNKCESKLTCKYESKKSVTSRGGTAGQAGTIGTAGSAGRGSAGGAGAGVYSSGDNTYTEGQESTEYVEHTNGNPSRNPNCEGGEGETKRCYHGRTTRGAAESRRGTKGEDGKDCTPSTPGTDGTPGQAGATGGDWGQPGGNITKGSRTIRGGAGGAAITGRSSHYEVTIGGGGSVLGST